MKPGPLTAKRRHTHGDWQETAFIAHQLRGVIDAALLRRRQRDPQPMAAYQVEALVQMSFKIARIVSGDPNHADHWDDIAGYAHLALGDK